MQSYFASFNTKIYTLTYTTKDFLFFFFQPIRKIVIATKTDLVTYRLYLYFAIEQKALKYSFPYNKQLG